MIEITRKPNGLKNVNSKKIPFKVSVRFYLQELNLHQQKIYEMKDKVLKIQNSSGRNKGLLFL